MWQHCSQAHLKAVESRGLLKRSGHLVSRVISTLIRDISRCITIVALLISLLAKSPDPLSSRVPFEVPAKASMRVTLEYRLSILGFGASGLRCGVWVWGSGSWCVLL